jgi:hypothetical protein
VDAFVGSRRPFGASAVSGCLESETLPDAVIVSPAAADDRLYYRRQSGPDLGDKFLCVVVKAVDAFVVTAYVTARQKKGVRVWPETT